MSSRPQSSTFARPTALRPNARAQSAPQTKPLRMRAPAPAPLPKALSPSMVAIMSEIVVKKPPKPQVLRPTQRPMSAVHAGAAGTVEAPSGVRTASAGCLGDGGGTAASLGKTVSEALQAQPGPRRKFGSQPPPDRSVHLGSSGFFERLNAQEAADKLDGIAGTTLPGAAALQEHRERAYVAAELARAEKAAVSAQIVVQQRSELAKASKAQVPNSQERFAWSSDRVASALLSKFDSFSARREDHTRKLLWTFGTDPHFKEPGTKRGAMQVTPKNFPHVCNRFGIACDERQAQAIFARHGLPADGCSMHKLTSRFMDSPLEMHNVIREQSRTLYGDGVRPTTTARPRTPKQQSMPFKNAFLSSEAWRAHAASTTTALE